MLDTIGICVISALVGMFVGDKFQPFEKLAAGIKKFFAK